jgi:hypothetical protein
VALRQGEDLVPVGRVWRARPDCDCLPLSQAAGSQSRQDNGAQSRASPRILLKIRIVGTEKAGREWRIIKPVIEDYSLDSCLDDIDELEKLISICPK